MLRQLRQKKVMKPFLWALAIVIILAFGLMGAGSLAERRSSIGSIFGRKVYPNEYKSAWEAVRNEALMTYGSRFYEISDQLDLYSQTWERLIMLDEAEQKNITVSDDEVTSFIARIPFFLDQSGLFNPQRYQSILANTFRRMPRRFEEDMRESLIISKLTQEVVKDVSISEEDIDAALEKEERIQKEIDEAKEEAEKKSKKKKKKDKKKDKKKEKAEEEQKTEEQALQEKRDKTKNNLFIQKRITTLQQWRDSLKARANLISEIEVPAEQPPTEEPPIEEPPKEEPPQDKTPQEKTE